MLRTETTQANSQKWLVTAMDPSVSNLLQHGKFLSVVHLPDPASGEQRPYLRVIPTESESRPKLLELQALPPDQEPFNSFFVVGDKKNYVVGDPMLYVVTPIDPLWWCLKDDQAPSDDNKDKKLQWQPLNQILPTFPVIVQSYLQLHSNKAVDKLFDQMKLSEDDDDDDVFYRFSATKALAWLQQKQEKVYKVLLQLELDKLTKDTAQNKNNTSSTNDSESKQITAGAFCSNFCLGGGGGDQQQNEPKELSPEEQEKQTAEQRERDRQRKEQQAQAAKTLAHRESVQVVCNYLPAGWQRAFLNHLQQDEHILLQSADSARKRKRVRQDDAASQQAQQETTEEEDSAAFAKPKKKDLPPPRNITAGAKRLAKVNTKGMAKMSSFFAVVSKKK